MTVQVSNQSSEEANSWRTWLDQSAVLKAALAIVGIAPLLTAAFYLWARALTAAFYAPLGLTPEDLGLDQLRLLSSSSSVAVVTLTAVFAAVLQIRVVALLMEQAYRASFSATSKIGRLVAPRVAQYWIALMLTLLLFVADRNSYSGLTSSLCFGWLLAAVWAVARFKLSGISLPSHPGFISLMQLARVLEGQAAFSIVVLIVIVVAVQAIAARRSLAENMIFPEAASETSIFDNPQLRDLPAVTASFLVPVPALPGVQLRPIEADAAGICDGSVMTPVATVFLGRNDGTVTVGVFPVDSEGKIVDKATVFSFPSDAYAMKRISSDDAMRRVTTACY